MAKYKTIMNELQKEQREDNRELTRLRKLEGDQSNKIRVLKFKKRYPGNYRRQLADK
ncbi:hypothetical protein [Carnobacterium maltaromaticum]|uniref:hypothetical protein n=1 Tax=Carnobacterium maltaromaticum TaxID=2751 RepID=UPI001430D8D1|nr:hypothetical protein [Carnobacterium maltaromaticum]